MNVQFSCDCYREGMAYAFSTENVSYLSNIDFKDKTCLSVIGGGCVPLYMGVLGAKEIVTFDCTNVAYMSLKLKYDYLEDFLNQKNSYQNIILFPR